VAFLAIAIPSCDYSFSQSSSQSSRTLLRRGGAFRRLLAASESSHSFDEPLDLVWESATTAEELVGAADEKLFWKLRHCRHHVLVELLPPESDTQHNLKKRRHNLTLPEKKGHLAAKNFLIRLLYKKTYELPSLCFPISYFFIVFSFNFPNLYFSVAFCQLFFTIKIRLDYSEDINVCSWNLLGSAAGVRR